MPDEPATFIYKTVQGCELRADVYGADAGRPPCPVVLFLHSGALILGSRRWAHPLHRASTSRGGSRT